jgi:hypothetical protein
MYKNCHRNCNLEAAKLISDVITALPPAVIGLMVLKSPISYLCT